MNPDTNIEDFIIHLADNDDHPEKLSPAMFFTRYRDGGDLHRIAKRCREIGKEAQGDLLEGFRLEKLALFPDKLEEGRKAVEKLEKAQEEFFNALQEALADHPSKIEKAFSSFLGWLKSLFAKVPYKKP
jgi:hypothetical protein